MALRVEVRHMVRCRVQRGLVVQPGACQSSLPATLDALLQAAALNVTAVI